MYVQMRVRSAAKALEKLDSAICVKIVCMYVLLYVYTQVVCLALGVHMQALNAFMRLCVYGGGLFSVTSFRLVPPLRKEYYITWRTEAIITDE